MLPGLTEGNHHLPRPGGDTSWNETLDSFLHSLLQWPIADLVSTRTPGVFYAKLTSSQQLQQVLVYGVVLPPVQGFVFTVVELREFPVCPLLQLVEVVLQDSTTTGATNWLRLHTHC